MAESIKTITEDRKNKLRKMKTVPPMVKVAVYSGANNAGVAMQFHTDVKLYNLWEALLYVESYEKQGFYEAGTVEKAVCAAFEREGEE